jgi:adenine phosphoribosyltransferase
MKTKETNQEQIKNSIRTIPNFPKEGIMFRDITTLLLNPEARKLVNQELDKTTEWYCFDKVAAIDSRGFIFGDYIATKHNRGLVLVRKKGKLPAKTISHEYKLEYGTDTLQIHEDAIKKGEKVLIVDDLLATGGTALAAANLIRKAGGIVAGAVFVIELPDLKGREKLELAGITVSSIVEFEGD